MHTQHYTYSLSHDKDNAYIGLYSSKGLSYKHATKT